MGSVISTRATNISCKSSAKSCLKRDHLESSGTLSMPQNERSSEERLRIRIRRVSEGILKIFYRKRDICIDIGVFI